MGGTAEGLPFVPMWGGGFFFLPGTQEVDVLKRWCIPALAVLLCLTALAACRKGAPPPDASPAPPGDSAVPAQPVSPQPPPLSEPQPVPTPVPEPELEPVSTPEPKPEPKPEPEPPPQPANTRLYVLMYHHFIREGEEYNDWMLTDTRFREDLEWLTNHNYVTILPSQLAAGEPLPRRAVMLTFDDGYRSNYELVYPLLQEYQARAVISVIGGYIQAEDPLFLTWDMCHEMARSGLVEIGSHTYACHDDGEHGIRRRKGESREDYEARVLPDLQTSIDLIQEKVGTAPIFFAYPNGKTEEWARDFIQAHFAVTVTTRHGPSDIAKGLYDLKRCNVSMGVPVGDILPE